MSIPHRIKMQMERLGMKPVDLARAMATQQSTVSRWLTAGSRPHFATLQRLAAILGVSRQWLEDGTGSVEPATGGRSPHARAHIPAITGGELQTILLGLKFLAERWDDIAAQLVHPKTRAEWVEKAAEVRALHAKLSA